MSISSADAALRARSSQQWQGILAGAHPLPGASCMAGICLRGRRPGADNLVFGQQGWGDPRSEAPAHRWPLAIGHIRARPWPRMVTSSWPLTIWPGNAPRESANASSLVRSTIRVPTLTARLTEDAHQRAPTLLDELLRPLGFIGSYQTLTRQVRDRGVAPGVHGLRACDEAAQRDHRAPARGRDPVRLGRACPNT